MTRAVLITGSSGYLGSLLVGRLATRHDLALTAVDVRPPASPVSGVHYATADIRAPELAEIVRQARPEVVVHLASIVTPGKGSRRDFEYSVDVGGTRNLLDACVAQGARRIVVSSSGAAYGYHADNPEWLTESDPLRGNHAFAYSWHKRLVEEMLAEFRQASPQLEQVVFRIGTILGATVRNQITNLFEKPSILAIKGSASPFVFIHDQDVVGAIVHALDSEVTGTFNLAGDGKLTIHEIAARLGKPVRELPAWLLKVALGIGHPLQLTRYGPEQLDFLRYRPVLSNARIKSVFGYVPQLTSAQAFETYVQSHSP